MQEAVGAAGSVAGRPSDKPMVRPPGLIFWLDDIPPLAVTLGLALQTIAIQSVYFVLPAAVAGMFTNDPTEATRFLCLSILASVILQVLQLLPRGPIGSGYPLPATHSAAMLSAYGLTASAGGGFAAAGAMVLIAGVTCIFLTAGMRRLRVLLPNEVAGVVVLLIGVALVILATQRLGWQPGGTPADAPAVAVLAVSIVVMVACALSGTQVAPFSVLFGALCGIALAVALGEGIPNAGTVIAESPWLALPRPWLPRFDQVTIAPTLAFVISLVAIQATTFGSLIVVQRAADAGWTRPDAAPLRRGLLANALGICASGILGGAAPAPATAAVGLAIATGTLARRLVWAGAAMLFAVALCPKVLALFVLVPEPVKAAMLFYVAGFVMAQGCQLITARLLDTRRTLIVAFGLSAGLAVAVAPQIFMADAPVIASPLSFGALVAFLVNLVTLPLVARRARAMIPVNARDSRELAEWFAAVGGSWGLKAQTVHAGEIALIEIMGLLAERGVPEMALAAQRAEDRVEVTVRWAGPRFPNPSARPHFEDLLGSDTAREAFALWMATRQAQGFSQRDVAGCTEARLILED
jgi:xanthine permease XanP